MNYLDEDGNLTGFETEFAEAVCEKLGVTPEFVEINWDTKFAILKSDQIDCIWNGMTISEEVKKNCDVSKAYVKNAQVVVMKDDGPNANPEKPYKAMMITVMARGWGFDLFAFESAFAAVWFALFSPSANTALE